MSEYKLQAIEIERQRYGDNKGQYKGTIKFMNAENEQFTFKLTEGKSKQYISLIAGEIVRSAGQLSQDLLKSLGLTQE